MEQTNTAHTCDRQGGPGDAESPRPHPPVESAATSADTTTPPTEPDTDFEPV